MLRIRMFKLPKAKQYNYIPVYYNQEKEEKEQRQSKETSYAYRIKGSFRSNKVLKSRSESVKANIRLFLIMLGLAALALYFLYS